MADGFKIGDAFIEVTADGDIDRDMKKLVRQAGDVGDKAGKSIGSSMVNALLGGGGGGGIVGTTLGVMATKFGVFAVAGAGALAIGQQLVGVIGLLPAAGIAGGLAMGTLAVGTQGFGDAMKNMGDPEKFAESISKLSPSAREAATAIQGLTPAWKDLQGSVQESLFANTGSRISALAGQYLPMLRDSMTSVAGYFNTALNDVITLFQDAGRAADMKMVLGSSATAIGNLTGMIGPLVSAFMDIAAVGAPILADLTANATGAATQFAAFVAKARESGQLGEWIQTGLQAFRDLWTIGSLLFGTVMNLVAAFGGPTSLLGVLTLVAGVLNTVAGFIRDNISWLGPLALAIGTVVAAVKVWQGVQLAMNAILMLNPFVALAAAVVAVVLLIVMNWDKVKAFLAATWDWIKSTASSLWEWMKSTVSGAMNFVRGIISSVWGAVQGIISGAVNGIKGILNWFGNLPGMFRGWFNSAKDAASTALGGLVSFVTGIPGKILGALGNVGSMLKNAGTALISGFYDGIVSKFNWVKDKVSGMMGNLRKLWPFSPAKEGPFSGKGYTSYSGAAMMSDWAKGMLSQSGSVQKAVDSIMGGIAPEFGMGLAGTAGAPVPAGVPVNAGSSSVNIASVTLQIAGNLDPTNPVAWRQGMENIHAGLREVERSYQ